MLSPNTAQQVIDHALLKGADFAEIYIERHLSSNLRTLNNDVDGVQSGIDFGIGIRLFFGFEIFYGYTQSDDLKSLYGLVDQLTAQKQAVDSPLKVVEFKSPVIQRLHRDATKPLSVASFNEEKVAFLRKAHAAA
ncbi:MAG TPA: peptidase C69, partial [Gammaproteobacteria bacterium]|nr:peptidase C69 [Gammaproteobacteria bacterium]